MRYLSRCLMVLAFASFGVSAQNVVTTSPASPTLDTSPDVFRSTTKIGSNAPTLQACIDSIKADAATRAPGTYAYSCRPGITSITARVTAPAPCPAKPADETRTQACPSGTTGSWTQAMAYTSAPAPTCWVAGEWLPTTAPAGACVAPPPPPPPPPVTTTMGVTSIQPSTDSGNGNLVVVQRATLAKAGTLRSLSFHVLNASGQLRMGVYDATGANGNPGARVAETAPFTPAAGWNTQPVLAPIELAAGTYWLAYHPSSSSLSFSTNYGAGRYCYQARTFGALPARYAASPSCGATEWSLYATLDGSSVPPPPPPPASGTASLRWDQPTDPVVTGWRVYWGTASRTYAQPLGAGVLVTGSPTYTVTGLPAGTHFFAVTAVTVDGRESAYSNEAFKTFP